MLTVTGNLTLQSAQSDFLVRVFCELGVFGLAHVFLHATSEATSTALLFGDAFIEALRAHLDTVGTHLFAIRRSVSVSVRNGKIVVIHLWATDLP